MITQKLYPCYTSILAIPTHIKAMEIKKHVARQLPEILYFTP